MEAMPKDANRNYIIDKSKTVFFPGGTNVCGETLQTSSSAFHLQRYIEDHLLTRVSLYLESTNLPVESNHAEIDVESDDSDTPLESSSFTLDNSVGTYGEVSDPHDYDIATNSVNDGLLGDSKGRKCLKEHQEEEYKLSLEADQIKMQERTEALENEVREVERLEGLRAARMQESHQSQINTHQCQHYGPACYTREKNTLFPQRCFCFVCQDSQN